MQIDNQKIRHSISYILIAIVSFVVGWQSTGLGLANTEPKIAVPETEKEDVKFVLGDEDEVDLSLFWLVWSELEREYVDTEVIDYQSMVYGAVKGMVDSLEDPYTVFMTPEESEQFTDSIEGNLEGIGAELTIEDQNLTVVSPLKNSPAEKAGLLPKDVIYLIDDKVAADMTLFDAIMAIRGEKGTTVVLTIMRAKVNEPIEISIVRDEITIESVTTEKIDGDIIYLSVNQFNDTTTQEFNLAISEMLLHQPKGLIIDLRFNGGGFLDTAVDMLGYLLPNDKEAVLTKERDKASVATYTKGQMKVLDVPLVVLVNEGSASASEIVAGAIQDHKRGIVMGTKTFGKGSVQKVKGFEDGSSIRMTIAKWFTPNGRSIDHLGLDPDIVVEMTEEDMAAKKDVQKDAAIKYLKELK